MKNSHQMATVEVATSSAPAASRDEELSAADARCRDEQLPRTSHLAGRSGQQVARSVQRDEELSAREAVHGAAARHVMKNSQRRPSSPCRV
ncbi:hypothetical protein [Pseudomonas aeruginosa]|uniref:hypothetical protein n=1 Tax=Pseudomonas aeruginosa TaxID=287 RepID=UPI0015E69DF0|nr:hypothetical protein [Pseudomonas aeruginosa]HCT4783666.1 hypothetical protein [Pseudomonas aeruginosa]